MDVTLHFVLIGLCLLVVAFLAGMETGVVAINRLRLLHRRRNGSRAAATIERFLRQPELLLGTTLVGSNLCLVVISTLAASLAESRWGKLGQLLTTAAVAITILVFGEYLPKAWFSSRPLQRCLPWAGLLELAERLMRPGARLVMWLTRWATPADPQAHNNPFVTREHLHLLARDSEAEGQISTFERLIIQRTLDLQLKTAADIMTPLAQVLSVRSNDDIAAAIEAVRRHGHKKVPVFGEGGSCVGVLYMQEVLGIGPSVAAQPATRHMQPPFFIDCCLPADEVLPLLRRHRRHLGVVRTAGGEVRGIITVENVLKLLLGNLPAYANSERKADPGGAIVAPPTATTAAP